MKKKQIKRLAKQQYKNYVHEMNMYGSTTVWPRWRNLSPEYKKHFTSQATPYIVVLETAKRITPSDTGMLKQSIEWRPQLRV